MNADERGLMWADAKQCTLVYDNPLCGRDGIKACTDCYNKFKNNLISVQCDVLFSKQKCVCVYNCN